jgi:hypothetical protein
MYHISYQAYTLYRMGECREGKYRVSHCALLTVELKVQSVELPTQENFIYLKKRKKTVKLETLQAVELMLHLSLTL